MKKDKALLSNAERDPAALFLYTGGQESPGLGKRGQFTLAKVCVSLAGP